MISCFSFASGVSRVYQRPQPEHQPPSESQAVGKGVAPGTPEPIATVASHEAIIRNYEEEIAKRIEQKKGATTGEEKIVLNQQIGELTKALTRYQAALHDLHTQTRGSLASLGLADHTALRVGEDPLTEWSNNEPKSQIVEKIGRAFDAMQDQEGFQKKMRPIMELTSHQSVHWFFLLHMSEGLSLGARAWEDAARACQMIERESAFKKMSPEDQQYFRLFVDAKLALARWHFGTSFAWGAPMTFDMLNAALTRLSRAVARLGITMRNMATIAAIAREAGPSGGVMRSARQLEAFFANAASRTAAGTVNMADGAMRGLRWSRMNVFMTSVATLMGAIAIHQQGNVGRIQDAAIRRSLTKADAAATALHTAAAALNDVEREEVERILKNSEEFTQAQEAFGHVFNVAGLTVFGLASVPVVGSLLMLGGIFAIGAIQGTIMTAHAQYGEVEMFRGVPMNDPERVKRVYDAYVMTLTEAVRLQKKDPAAQFALLANPRYFPDVKHLWTGNHEFPTDSDMERRDETSALEKNKPLILYQLRCATAEVYLRRALPPNSTDPNTLSHLIQAFHRALGLDDPEGQPSLTEDVLANERILGAALSDIISARSPDAIVKRVSAAIERMFAQGYVRAPNPDDPSLKTDAWSHIFFQRQTATGATEYVRYSLHRYEAARQEIVPVRQMIKSGVLRYEDIPALLPSSLVPPWDPKDPFAFEQPSSLPPHLAEVQRETGKEIVRQRLRGLFESHISGRLARYATFEHGRQLFPPIEDNQWERFCQTLPTNGWVNYYVSASDLLYPNQPMVALKFPVELAGGRITVHAEEQVLYLPPPPGHREPISIPFDGQRNTLVYAYKYNISSAGNAVRKSIERALHTLDQQGVLTFHENEHEGFTIGQPTPYTPPYVNRYFTYNGQRYKIWLGETMANRGVSLCDPSDKHTAITAPEEKKARTEATLAMSLQMAETLRDALARLPQRFSDVRMTDVRDGDRVVGRRLTFSCPTAQGRMRYSVYRGVMDRSPTMSVQYDGGLTDPRFVPGSQTMVYDADAFAAFFSVPAEEWSQAQSPGKQERISPRSSPRRAVKNIRPSHAPSHLSVPEKARIEGRVHQEWENMRRERRNIENSGPGHMGTLPTTTPELLEKLRPKEQKQEGSDVALPADAPVQGVPLKKDEEKP